MIGDHLLILNKCEIVCAHRGEYTHMGAVLEFTAAYDLGVRFKKKSGHHLAELRPHGQQWNYVASQDAVVFVDNHDNQRHNSGDIINFKSRKLYTMAWAFLLAHSYGIPSLISSYKFDDFDEGTVFRSLLAPYFSPTYFQT